MSLADFDHLIERGLTPMQAAEYLHRDREERDRVADRAERERERIALLTPAQLQLEHAERDADRAERDRIADRAERAQKDGICIRVAFK